MSSPPWVDLLVLSLCVRDKKRCFLAFPFPNIFTFFASGKKSLCHLKNCEAGLWKSVEMTSDLGGVFKLSAEYLHSQQRKYEYEEEQDHEEGVYG